MIHIKRHMNIVNKKYMNSLYSSEYSLDKLTFLKVKKLYKIEGYDLTSKFFHNAISEWAKKNYNENDVFLIKFKRYIRKTKIKLNDIEKDKLLILEERVFSKERHIKKLLINLPLAKKEIAGVKFMNANLYEDNIIKDNGSLIFTNLRIILEGSKLHDFYFSNISKIDKLNEGLQITIDNKTYLFRIHDQKSLINTFENYYRKKVAKLV